MARPKKQNIENKPVESNSAAVAVIEPKTDIVKNKGGRPKKISIPLFLAGLEAYLLSCYDEQGNIIKRPLKSELAYLLGLTKDDITDYGKLPQTARAVKKLENLAESYLNRKLDASASNQNAMFALKTQHQYIEAQYLKVDVTSNGQTLGVVELPQR